MWESKSQPVSKPIERSGLLAVDGLMPRQPTPAQRAVQVTFVLKGHLKNVQLSYLRVAALLARMRDERLYEALKHPTLEDYASVRLGLQRTSLYRYLQVYEWVRQFHSGWLARKPKGFIPELTDAYALMWLDHRLASEKLDPKLRKRLEAMQRKALSGKLSLAEFQALQREMGGQKSPLRQLLSSLRAVRRRAAKVPGFPAEILIDMDALVRRVAGLAAARARLGTLRLIRGGRG